MGPGHKEILRRLHLLPKRYMGQNFLIDEGVRERIITEARVTGEDTILEVGPGLGVLTFPLAERAHKVIAIEKDRTLAGYLREEAGEGSNIEIIEGDALEISYREMAERVGRRLKVVSNLPYSIASPLLLKFLDEREAFCSLLVMVQREVGLRIAAEPGTGNYGFLTVMVRLLADASIVTIVPPRAFYPRPKVHSALVSIEVLEEPRVGVEDMRAFRELVSHAFGKRRKILKNALRSLLGDRAEEILTSAGIDPKRRGETLTLEEFYRIYRVWVERAGG